MSDQRRSPLSWTTALPESVTLFAGSVWTSLAATVLVATLIVIGVVTGFPAWWQALVYSTGALTSILMLFLIQHTTNRQTIAVLMKLDELVIATTGAREEVIDIEDRQLHEQEQIHERLHHNDEAPGAVPGTAPASDHSAS